MADGRVTTSTEPLLGPEQEEALRMFIDEGSVDCEGILEYLGYYISHGISDGRFTERQAHHDLGVALWVAFACNSIGDYEHYFTSAEWLSRVEDLSAGCGPWYHRYAVSLMYCGKPGRALEYCERGVREDPDYLPTWLTLGRLRAHFGDRRGAGDAVARGLELSPDDQDFLQLRRDIEEGATIEQMEAHRIGEDDVHLFTAIDGIVCDRQALDRLKTKLGITGWSADHPYCTYLMNRGEGAVMVSLLMNEAQASKKDPDAIGGILDCLDDLDTESRAYLEETSGVGGHCLYGVSIGPAMNVRLSYGVPRSEEIRIVDFDSDLDLVRESDGGPFAAMVLLSSDDWDPGAIIKHLRENWGIVLADADVGEDALIGMHEGNIIAVSLMHARVPGDEAEENASYNYRWPGAVDAASAHVAHLVVALVNHAGEPLDCGLTFTKIVESCAVLPNVLGIYGCGTVFEPGPYIEDAQCMKVGDLPLDEMVWFGMYRTSEGINAYTMGMAALGWDEMEIIGADDDPSNVASFLYDVAYHLLFNRMHLRDGDTFGFYEDQELPVRKGPGVSVEGMTLKIGYPEKGSDNEVNDC